MSANLGLKSTVNEGLVFYLDAANPYSNPISTQGDTSPPWNDLSEYKYGGNIYNSPTYSNTGASSYIEFNAVNQYYKITNTTSTLTFGANPFSIEFWVNRYDREILLDCTAFRSLGLDPYPYIDFRQGYSNRLVYRPYDESSVIFGGSADNPTATDTTWTGWRHYVISREGTGTNECKLYYNGSLVSQGTDANTHIMPYTYVLANSWELGNLSSDAFYGRIGLFKVYNSKALSATEVLQNYNVTKVRYE